MSWEAFKNRCCLFIEYIPLKAQWLVRVSGEIRGVDMMAYRYVDDFEEIPPKLAECIAAMKVTYEEKPDDGS